MKTTELAKRLGVSCMTVRRMAADGRIPGARATKGGHYYFSESEKFCAWLERQQAAAASQAKEEKRRRLEKLTKRAAMIYNLKRELRVNLPHKGRKMSVSECFQACSQMIQEAFLVQKRSGCFSTASEWAKDYRDTLLLHLAPLEAIANELRHLSVTPRA